jgi:hypothetical protein
MWQEPPRTRIIAGIPAWERERVAAASFLLFCRWMATFPESVICEVAELAAELAASGCPWAVERAQTHLKVPAYPSPPPQAKIAEFVITFLATLFPQPWF